ncbi:MAG: tetratricopeptide repeat protein [Ekhidna sp.]
MKKSILVLTSVLCFTLTFANGQFEKAMGKNIPSIFQAKDKETLQSSINQLNRIGEAEENRWEPHYYVAFGYLRMMTMSEGAEKQDAYLDQALTAIENAESIESNNSELVALRGYVHMMRVTVDPATRGMQYSGMAFNDFNKAVQLNPENPRAHYLLGQMQYGTAQFMGGGDGGACESFHNAKKLFDAKGDAQSIAPSWGAGENEGVIAQLCKG